MMMMFFGFHLKRQKKKNKKAWKEEEKRPMRIDIKRKRSYHTTSCRNVPFLTKFTNYSFTIFQTSSICMYNFSNIFTFLPFLLLPSFFFPHLRFRIGFFALQLLRLYFLLLFIIKQSVSNFALHLFYPIKFALLQM